MEIKEEKRMPPFLWVGSGGRSFIGLTSEHLLSTCCMLGTVSALRGLDTSFGGASHTPLGSGLF